MDFKITSIGGERELFFSATRNFVVSVQRSFLFLWTFRKSCVILLWHSLDLQYKYPAEEIRCVFDDSSKIIFVKNS